MGRYDGKTEKASPRKRQEARGEGQVARSQELGVAVSLFALLLVLVVIVPTSMRSFAEGARALFRHAAMAEVDGPLVSGLAIRVGATALGPVLAMAVVSALVAGVAQVGFRITPKAAKPKLSRLNPKQGLEKLRPSNALWELVRSTLKIGLLVAVSFAPLSAVFGDLVGVLGLDSGLPLVTGQVTAIVVRAALAMALVAAVDYAVNRRKHEKSLMMSKEDVKQENKNSQGDPLVKGERRKRAAMMSRNRMLAGVADADVVVTNPTHFAVALSYDEADGAPRVLAKGTDEVAATIRNEARRHGVMVIEDRPLARALYRRVQVGSFVPADLYEAVAVVLAVVYRRRARIRANRVAAQAATAPVALAGGGA